MNIIEKEQKLYDMAKKYIKFKNCEKAIEYLKQALEHKPNFVKDKNKIKIIQDLIDDIIILTFEEKILYEKKIIQKKRFEKTIKDFGSLLEYAESLSKTELRNKIRIAKIKRNILDLGTTFFSLEIGEIVIICNENEDLIIQTINKMIKDKEIYAKYFVREKMVVFNLKANIEKINKSLESYKDKEENQFKE